MPKASSLSKKIADVPTPDGDPALKIISAGFKKLLIEWITVGIPVRDKMTGVQVIDPDGSPAFRSPTASEASVIRQFLQTAAAKGDINDHDEVEKAIAKMRELGLKFPGIDDEDDEATRA